MPSRTSPALLALACAAAASLLLAACGGSSSSPPEASEGRPEDLARFARCLREHGVNVSAPPGKEGALKITGSGSPQSFEAAQRACQRYRPAMPSMSPAKRIEFQDAALKFTRCMREHGVNMPDPEFGSGGKVVITKGRTGRPGLNPATPTFQAAQKACQGILPGGGPKAQALPPGPPPGGPGGRGANGAEMYFGGR
jgi:hypothetical protein